MVSNLKNFITPDMLGDNSDNSGQYSNDDSQQMGHRGNRRHHQRDNSPEDSNGGKTISQRQVRKLLQKNPLELHLPDCSLYHWDDLMPLTPMMVDMLKIDLSNNKLINIDFLNQLQQLRYVKVRNNYLRSANLEIAHLNELDLRNNFIDTMPALSLMPKLHILSISANNLKEFKLTVSRSNFNNMQKIVIKNNKINFNSGQLQKFINKISQFKHLKVLNMEENPYEASPKIVKRILMNLPDCVDMFNNARKAFVQKSNDEEVAQEDEDAGPHERSARTAEQIEMDMDQMSERQTHEHHQKPKLMPTLETMIYTLEIAMNYPSKALACVKQLYIDAEVVIAQQMQSVYQEEFDKQFMMFSMPTSSPDEQEEQITISIEKFMQLNQMLIDNHKGVRNIIVQILSKLTIIHTNGFGARCFYCLKDLMKADSELMELVRKHIDTNIVQQLNQRPPKHIHFDILQGLIELVNDTELNASKLMTQLLKDFFPKWLSEFKENLVFQKNISQFKIKQIDAILALLSASLRNDQENVDLMIDMQLHIEVAEIFTKTQPSASRYLFLLHNLIEISKQSEVAAGDFLDRFVHVNLIQDVKLILYQFKKITDFKTTNKAEKVKQYKQFSAQVELIGALLNAPEQQQDQILWDSVTLDLMGLINHNRVDPLLLKAVCYLAYMVFKNDKVALQHKELEPRLFKTQYCENLLTYLGPGSSQTRFAGVIEDVRKYDGEQDIEVIDDQEDNVQMETYDNPIIHALFEQIVVIIEHFSKMVSNSGKTRKGVVWGPDLEKLNALYEQVAERMNDLDREDALFSVLKLPNDDVKLMVVKTLRHIPLDQFDKNEMSHLIELTQSYQNIGTGKTEIVLSIIFHLFSSFVGDIAQRNQDAVEIFKSLYGEKAITLGLTILFRNMNRVVKEDDEEKEKYILAVSVVNFLLLASKDAVLASDLAKQATETGVFKAILFAEQSYTSNQQFLNLPIILENTSIGQSFDSLKSVISQGFQCLSPYNFVSFRIIHAIANLLMLEKQKDILEPIKAYEINIDENDYDTDIMEKYTEELQRKIAYERNIWSDFNRVKNKDRLEAIDMENLAIFKLQHENFTKKNGLQTILHFLNSQVNEVENWLRVNSDPSIVYAGSPNNHPVYGMGLEYRIQAKKNSIMSNLASLRDTEESKMSAELMFMKRSKVTMNVSNQDQNKKHSQQEKKMLSSLRSAELGIGYQPTSTELYLASNKLPRVVQRLRHRESHKMSIQNPQQRSLNIAAFLRCIQASIESAPSDLYYEEAVANIRSDKIFTELSQLCSSTGWIDANVGSKYMQLMLYVFHMDMTHRLEDPERIYKYEVLSIVIRRIMGLLEAQIKNNNGNKQISDNEIFLLMHVTNVSSMIINQCTLFDLLNVQELDQKIESRQMRDLRKDMIAYVMQLLFPITVVRQIIDLVFMEMKRSMARLHGLIKPFDEDDPQAVLLKMARIHTSESAKKFLSIYIAYQPELKYDVLQYIMTNVCYDQQAIRASFLEEVLEGANQILLSQKYILALTEHDSKNEFEMELKTVSYQHAREIEFMKESVEQKLEKSKKSKDRVHIEDELDMMNRVLANLKADKYLGERLVFNQPILCHIKVMDKPKRSMGMHFRVFNVILTNHGIYIIDDSEDSFKHDPNDHEQSQVPPNTLRFSYKQIQKMYSAQKLDQRVMIKVERELVEYGDNWWHNDADMTNSSRRSRHSHTKQTASNTQMNQSSKRSKYGDDEDDEDPVSETLLITFILGNSIDCHHLQEIIAEALQQQQTEAELDDENSKIEVDRLLHNAMISKLRQSLNRLPPKGEVGRIQNNTCPVCSQKRVSEDCGCDHFVVYCYRLKQEKTLRLFNKSRQRGGATRLLATDLTEHKGKTRTQFQQIDNEDDPVETAKLMADQPELGLLMITDKMIYFFKENPQRWEDHINKTQPKQFEAIFKSPDQTQMMSQSQMSQQKKQDPNANKQMQQLQLQTQRLGEYITIGDSEKDRFYMNAISSIRIINGKVPTIELEIQKGVFGVESTYFSMISDHNTQETLLQLKRIKKLGRKLAKAKQEAALQKPKSAQLKAKGSK